MSGLLSLKGFFSGLSAGSTGGGGEDEDTWHVMIGLIPVVGGIDIGPSLDRAGFEAARWCASGIAPESTTSTIVGELEGVGGEIIPALWSQWRELLYCGSKGPSFLRPMDPPGGGSHPLGSHMTSRAGRHLFRASSVLSAPIPCLLRPRLDRLRILSPLATPVRDSCSSWSTSFCSSFAKHLVPLFCLLTVIFHCCASNGQCKAGRS